VLIEVEALFMLSGVCVVFTFPLTSVLSLSEAENYPHHIRKHFPRVAHARENDALDCTQAGSVSGEGSSSWKEEGLLKQGQDPTTSTRGAGGGGGGGDIHMAHHGHAGLRACLALLLCPPAEAMMVQSSSHSSD